ncbi:hypothetical protein HYN59_02035 [Flavobacterium album]|uniref:Membrane or secreted protein n=1 Tax=Flavobacterium album TaxID=2175091 RepID=A0A2S1QUA3_9FLAO|nr:hypothetical protein [Flavobacterium album]AWH83964.1 hypothetical protein HYN59_02035 [Flavobacterium album]
MKRKIVLVVLLILPLTMYVYFSMAKHNSLFLPVITKNVAEAPPGKTLDDKPVHLKGKITIVGFLGKDIIKKKETIFNVNQKINNKYKDFTDFQLLMIVPDGAQDEVKQVISELKAMGDISNWKFIFAQPQDITDFYKSLKVREPLGADFSTYNIFILDKDSSLRGRKGKDKETGEDEFKDAYNSFSAAELHNEMTDDVKILLREYRLALRKNDTLKGVKREI